jgi:hydroxyacylglutathione hydrolase
MKIHKVAGLMASCFLIEDDGLFLIDTGFLGFEKKIIKKIRAIGRKPEDLRLILITHAHIDHFGGLGGIHSLSGAPVACHRLESEGVEKGSKDISPSISPWADVLSFLAAISLPFMRTQGVRPEVILEDGELLGDFGLGAKVLHTPGHTGGSISLLLEDGSAITGDLIMGRIPIRYKPLMPSFAEDTSSVYDSWQYLLKAGAKTFYPAHGHPFSASELEELIDAYCPN